MAGPFDLYQQRTSAPNVVNMPSVRPADFTRGNVGATLAGAGRAVAQIGQQFDEIEQRRIAQEEDDARVYVSSAMAQARASANQMRQSAFANAPDGWRGATDGVANAWRQEREKALAAAPTPSAQRFLSQAFDTFEPALLDAVAEEETNARRAWRVDTVRSSVTTDESTLAADPGQYSAMRAQKLELIETMTDLTADQRRDMIATVEERYALATVGGMIERDPYGALRLLDDAEAGGPFPFLGEHRRVLRNQAQAEINRRESEARARQAQWQASLRDAVNAQNQLLAQGIMPQQPLPLSTVAQLGPDVAQNYAANLAKGAAMQSLTTVPSAGVAQLGAQPIPEGGSEVERLMTNSVRTAAAETIRLRAQDPGRYGVQNGLFRSPNLMGELYQAIQTGNWQGATMAMRQRGADAVEARRRGILPSVSPLSQAEADALGAQMQRLPAQQRAAFFSQLRTGFGDDAYQAVMRQLAPQNRVAAEAGAVFAQRHHLEMNGGNLTGRAVAERMLRGADLINPPEIDGRRAQPFAMPKETDLRTTWRNLGGEEAYRRTNHGSSAYEAFRSYYAARASDLGQEADSVNSRIAEEAFSAATGGVMMWNGRHTILPWGRNAGAVRNEIERAWPELQARNPVLAGHSPDDFDLQIAGQNRYWLMEGQAVVKDRFSVPIVVRLRDPTDASQ